MNRFLIFHQIIHNPIMGSILIGSFLKGYGKEASYNLILTVLPLLFSNENFEKLSTSNSRSNFYSFLKGVNRTDFIKEMKMNLSLSKESIIIGFSNGIFTIENNNFKYKKLELKNSAGLKIYKKSAENLGTIFSKFTNEKEIFYHLMNY